MEIHVSFKGKSIVLANFKSNDSVCQVKKMLQEETGINEENQKLIHKGRAVSNSTLVNDLVEEGKPMIKFLLVGSKSEEIAEVTAPKPAARIRDDLSSDRKGGRQGQRRVTRPKGPPSPYRFGRIETLPDLPDQAKARGILEQLANDPGILKVMEKHRWAVGALCELYPEGEVGISEVCVLGLNQNRGQKILLRLRTDDLQGFRKFLGTKKVLYHELAHMVYDDHDDNFYQLMRQIEREATDMDWTQSKGRTLSGFRQVYRPPEGGDEDYNYTPAYDYEGGSHTLGGDTTLKDLGLSARELAASAAQLRLTEEEKQIEDMCGCSHKHKTPEVQEVQKDGGISSMETEMTEPAFKLSAEVSELPSVGGVSSMETETAGFAVKAPAEVSELPSDAGIPAIQTETTDPAPLATENSELPPAPSSAVHSSVSSLVTKELEGAGNLSENQSQPFTEELQELVSMGFAEDKSRVALSRFSGSVSAALEWLLSGASAPQPPPSLDNPDILRRPREERLQHFGQLVITETQQAQTIEVLDMLIKILQNIMENPAEQKYKALKKTNAKFKRTVGSVPSAVQFLIAAGFEDCGDAFSHKRDDIGLLWLGKNIVEQQKSNFLGKHITS